VTKTSAILQQRDTLDRAEEEPPGSTIIKSETEEEPPSSTATTFRNRFFSHIPDESWNDWKWHFRNRITTVEELAKYLPLSARDQSRLKLVVTKYPLAITPYYLSLIDPHDPDDPVRKQAVPSFDEVAFAGMGMEDPLERRGTPLCLGWFTAIQTGTNGIDRYMPHALSPLHQKKGMAQWRVGSHYGRG